MLLDSKADMDEFLQLEKEKANKKDVNEMMEKVTKLELQLKNMELEQGHDDSEDEHDD